MNDAPGTASVTVTDIGLVVVTYVHGTGNGSRRGLQSHEPRLQRGSYEKCNAWRVL